MEVGTSEGSNVAGAAPPQAFRTKRTVNAEARRKMLRGDKGLLIMREAQGNYEALKAWGAASLQAGSSGHESHEGWENTPKTKGKLKGQE